MERRRKWGGKREDSLMAKFSMAFVKFDSDSSWTFGRDSMK